MNVKHYIDEQTRVAKNLAGNHLTWLQELRQNAIEQFAARGFPTLRDEEWKYTNTAPLAKQAFQLAQPFNGKLNLSLPDAALDTLDCYRLTFIDGYFSKDLSHVDDLPAGVVITSLAQALAQDCDKLKAHLARHANAKSSAFTALNSAFIHDGAYLYLPKNVHLKKPIQLLFIASCQETLPLASLHNLFVADENSQAVIIENYLAVKEGNHFTNTVTEINLQPHATIEHHKLIQENKLAFHIGTLQVEQHNHSQFTSHSFALSGALVRSDINIQLTQEHAACTLNGLYLLRDRQHVDHHTLIDHTQSHGTSLEYYKGVIADRARAVFNGKVLVRPGALKTNAQQANKNLLLSEEAEIDSKPELEIYADDVKCSHGATVGQLDEAALFYLQSRGLSAQQAKATLIQAFTNDMLERVTIAPLRAKLSDIINNLP